MPAATPGAVASDSVTFRRDRGRMAQLAAASEPFMRATEGSCGILRVLGGRSRRGRFAHELTFSLTVLWVRQTLESEPGRRRRATGPPFTCDRPGAWADQRRRRVRGPTRPEDMPLSSSSIEFGATRSGCCSTIKLGPEVEDATPVLASLLLLLYFRLLSLS